MKVLIPHVGDIDDDDKHGRTALHQASWSGYEACVRLLLDNGADINKLDEHSRTPLFFATLGSSLNTITLLLDQLLQKSYSISEINHATKRSRAPLRQAAAHGFTNVVERLLKLIKDDSEVDRAGMIDKADTLKGRTALHCAAFRGHTDCVRSLLKAGADGGIKDQGGSTALQLSYTQWEMTGLPQFESIVDLLIDTDSSTAAQDTELVSAAAINGSKHILEKLHRYGADLKQIDQYGWTPLMLAQHFSRTEAEEYLTQQDTWVSLLGFIPKLSETQANYTQLIL